MKNILFVLIVTLIISCTNPRVSITFENDSGRTIDSVIITNGYDNVKLDELKSNNKAKGFLYFSDKIRSDGSYGLKIYKDGDLKLYSFGYYSNGLPLSESFNILYENDTIRVDE